MASRRCHCPVAGSTRPTEALNGFSFVAPMSQPSPWWRTLRAGRGPTGKARRNGQSPGCRRAAHGAETAVVGERSQVGIDAGEVTGSGRVGASAGCSDQVVALRLVIAPKQSDALSQPFPGDNRVCQHNIGIGEAQRRYHHPAHVPATFAVTVELTSETLLRASV